MTSKTGKDVFLDNKRLQNLLQTLMRRCRGDDEEGSVSPVSFISLVLGGVSVVYGGYGTPVGVYLLFYLFIYCGISCRESSNDAKFMTRRKR